MSISVQKISFTGNLLPNPERKEKVQDAAAVAGGTGFVAKATSMASKKGLKTVQSAQRGLKTTMDAAAEAAHMASDGLKQSSGYIAQFKNLSRKYYGDAIRFMGRFKNNRFIKPIIKSPVAKGLASAFGGSLAFFVLISGIAEAAESGNNALSDFKNKYLQMKSI